MTQYTFMKILEVKSLAFPEVKVIRFGRFNDSRGYFSEPWRASDFKNLPELGFIKNINFVQTNESQSHPHTVRGLHFQWSPNQGKLVRTLYGHMVDIILDIRKNSPTFGKAIMFDMPQNAKNEYSEWIWVPPGFAHGNYYIEESAIEYFCSAEYSPKTEAGISPLAAEIDWSLADGNLVKQFKEIVKSPNLLMSDKDKNGLSVKAWAEDSRSENFIY